MCTYYFVSLGRVAAHGMCTYYFVSLHDRLKSSLFQHLLSHRLTVFEA